MFSSPSVQTTQRRNLPSAALRSSGSSRAIDDDVSMRDAPGAARRPKKDHSKPLRSKRLEKMELDAQNAGKNASVTIIFYSAADGFYASAYIRGAGSSSAGSSTRADGTAPPSRIPRRNVIVERPAGAERAPSVEILGQLINQRYNPEAQFLNLEHLQDDEILKKHKIVPLDAPTANKRMGPVLFKLASELNPPVKTISLANNNFTHTQHLATLNHYLPNLNALSLENNKIRSFRDLDGLSVRAVKGSIPTITELILRGNPIRDDAIKHDRLDSYKNDALRRFPSLSVLDQEALPRVTFDVEAATVNAAQRQTSPSSIPNITSFPAPMGPSLFAGGVEGVSATFLTRYFTQFDTDRAPLEAVYAPHATFSLSLNTSLAPRAKKRGLAYSADLPNQKSLKWDSMHHSSRNLARVSNDGAIDLLRTGPQQIMAALKAFPGTTHAMTKPEAFSVDAFPMVGVVNTPGYGTDALIINVHGEFAEAPVNGLRSFDRSFMLTVAPADSPAQQAGWPVIIISDMFTVRQYSHPDVWTQGELEMPGPIQNSRPRPPAPASAPANPPATTSASGSGGAGQAPRVPPSNSLTSLQNDPILANVPDNQKPLLIQLAQQTGLTIQFAGQALEGNNWDVQAAFANVQQVKDSLPPEAWLRR
ncbi:NTF2-like protein [Clavulina sp. PMI_390]|nr:NTF2-like protein [Clavulina sp. PMI_390]